MPIEIFQLASFSANDSLFAPTRNRTNPLPNTTHHIANYPNKLVIYKIQASRFWQVRCWFDGRYFKKSTKTQSLLQAKKAARFFFEETLALRYISNNDIQTISHSHSKEQNITFLTFGAIAAQMLTNEEARCSRGEISHKGLKTLKNRLDKFILPRWSTKSPKEITHQTLLEFSQYLSTTYKTTTISQYLILIKKVLSHALATGHLDKLPEFPKIKVISIPRGGFTPSEYWHLLKTARRDEGKENPHTSVSSSYYIRINHIDRVFPKDVAWIIGFMVNSFIRPSDIFNLKHKHIEIVKSHNVYLRLTLPESKKHDKPIVTLFPAVRIYLQIVKYQSQKGLSQPDDFLFFPKLRNREYVRSILWIHFNWLLNRTGLKKGPHGQSRSMYSLRHSAITFRLLYGQGIDLLTLARNSRTSVEMINKYYASALTGEQNIALLQSRRSKKSTS